MSGKSKGAVWLATATFVQKKFGAAALATCLDEMSAEERATIAAVIPAGWYPLDMTLKFAKIADRQLGAGDLALCRDIGAYSADWQLNTFHRVFLRFKRPLYLIERASSMWGSFHDSGQWELSEQGPNRYHALLRNYSTIDESFAIRLEGWLEKALSVCGAEQVRASETAVRRGERSNYRFEVEWR